MSRKYQEKLYELYLCFSWYLISMGSAFVSTILLQHYLSDVQNIPVNLDYVE